MFTDTPTVSQPPHLVLQRHIRSSLHRRWRPQWLPLGSSLVAAIDASGYHTAVASTHDHCCRCKASLLPERCQSCLREHHIRPWGTSAKGSIHRRSLLQARHYHSQQYSWSPPLNSVTTSTTQANYPAHSSGFSLNYGPYRRWILLWWPGCGFHHRLGYHDAYPWSPPSNLTWSSLPCIRLPLTMSIRSRQRHQRIEGNSHDVVFLMVVWLSSESLRRQQGRGCEGGGSAGACWVSSRSPQRTTRTGGCGVHSEFQICVICLYMFLIIYEWRFYFEVISKSYYSVSVKTINKNFNLFKLWIPTQKKSSDIQN